MRDLMAAVGEVLLFWGFLETAIRGRLAVIDTVAVEAKPATKASVLAQWRNAEADRGDARVVQLFADIEEVAALRNCLAHGLSSASADPWSGKEAKVVCLAPDGSRSVTITEMQDAKDYLHGMTNRVRDLSI
ncbi:hypothetical protein LHFGNBLO_003304 [Mesorhizobium sp. AR10]|uniref:hypothetical protein n=1 Tax=Mesorhizobium sp. AR10 TaxID=2865839 RepID=UPI00215F8333|nr:hypothetical protein [Mesorhizobium sp. AR10]UVK36390.1 hypothetical protein LHFGNBLO_003304 [Mesorhizobium sp. AR10]